MAQEDNNNQTGKVPQPSQVAQHAQESQSTHAVQPTNAQTKQASPKSNNLAEKTPVTNIATEANAPKSSEASTTGTNTKPKKEKQDLLASGGMAGADDDSKPQEIKSDTFYIDLRPRLIKLPPFENQKEINVRYPLIPPFAFAHIFWDINVNELIYSVEEPKLDNTEKELLELIQLGLEEMINISFVRASKTNILLKYLEKNVQNILIELGAKVSSKTYKKIMYYIYRNSVGLNEIEPLMSDYYIEDIECNGLNFPIYIVHRKYQNLRTTVKFSDEKYMTDFVEKLAQKAGRYVSYAKPLLDGTLPDGSRVNAVYSSDVTIRGPTFTIRKFTKEPWTPVHLIKFKTASAAIFAYMWLVIEHKFNVLVVGETASGKTTFLNAVVNFIPPEARICSIEDTAELNLAHDNWLPAVTRSGFGMPNILGEQYGEITLFDLLRETFRQNPDYVIVGEIRGKEAYVLFQGMASGHPSFATFHAGSVDTVVKRLETPPINLSPSLVESLDVVCIATHVKDSSRNFRRMKTIAELLGVEQALGKAHTNDMFKWDAAKDTVKQAEHSHIFDRITERTGISYEDLQEEHRLRTALLQKLADSDSIDFKSFGALVNRYYKDPKAVLKEHGIK